MSMNRYFNFKNPYQGTMKKVLCLCSAGLLRSPTAAVVLQREFGFNTRSAGVTLDIALIPAEDGLCEWADEIVVMEDYMVGQVHPLYRDKTIVLGIEDNYEYMSPTLQRLIKEKYEQRSI